MRKLLMLAAVAVLPAGFIVASASVASATTLVNNGAPHYVQCNQGSGGTLAFKTPVGIVTPGGYQAPTKNKGNKITITGVGLSQCFEDGGGSPFSGVASGKITITNPSQTPAQFYSCGNLVGNIPGIPRAGGTLSGTLKIKWTPPPGTKFTQKKSTVRFSDAKGIPDGPAVFFKAPDQSTPSVSGGFPGPDGGVGSEFASNDTTLTLAAITAQCTTAGGVSSLALALGVGSGGLALT